jgi:hypothetical protein
VQILQKAATCANRLVFHHTRIWGTVLSIGWSVLIDHLFLGDKQCKFSGGFW